MSQSQEDVSLYVEGQNRFSALRTRSFFTQMLDILSSKPVELLSFDDVRARLALQCQVERGLQDVPLDRIVGSVGRSKDFTRRFLPRNNSMSDRWSRVYALFHSLEGLPPIELYKIDDVYFVRDGNHRVSVARELGHNTIQAYVTELPTPIDIEPNMSPRQWDAASAYAHFLEDTQLNISRPHQQKITMTEPGSYQVLREHVELVRQVMEYREGRAVTMKEAAARWYDTVYEPAIRLIRKYGVLEQSSAHTEADLYLWLVEHLRHLKAIYGEQREARLSEALVDFLAAHKIPVPKPLILENDDPVV